MQCHHCDQAIELNWLFCPSCGVSLETAKEKPPRPSIPDDGYKKGVRGQVLEVIVRQALKGAPWREICVGPMQVNNITTTEVEEEVRRRRGGDNEPPSASVPKRPVPPAGSGNIALALPLPTEQLTSLRSTLLKLAQTCEADPEAVQPQLLKIVEELDSLLTTLQRLQQSMTRVNSEAQLQQDLLRERLQRIKQELKPGDEKGPHHVT